MTKKNCAHSNAGAALLRSVLGALALFLAMVGLAPFAHPEGFPERPIRIIIPWAAGGGTDAVLRPLADAAAKRLGQPVVIENRPGASGTIGVGAMVQSKPDGYTLALIPVTIFTAAHIMKLPFHPVNDLTYITQLSGYTFGLVVRSDSPWKSVDDLVAYARAHPGELTYATSGSASPGHLAMEQISAARNVKFLHVPYKGAAEALPALLGGHLQAIAFSSAWAPHVDAGKLRLLATFGASRTKRWPQVPTLKELGYDVVDAAPYGIAGPRNLNPQVLGKLHDALRVALEDHATRKAMERLDQVPAYLGPADYAESARRLFQERGELIKRLGVGER